MYSAFFQNIYTQPIEPFSEILLIMHIYPHDYMFIINMYIAWMNIVNMYIAYMFITNMYITIIHIA